MRDQNKLLIWLIVCAVIVFSLFLGIINDLNIDIQNVRNQFVPDFAYRYDDYIIYLPILVMFGLTFSGKQSASGWKKMLVCSLFSFALMLIVTNIIKSAADVIRPDGTDDLSFPSGHTAAAFTASTLLYKEYGYKRKWSVYFIYLSAVATGLTRILNNRHWLSDVIAGALIGITCVLLVYTFAYMMEKKKPIENKERDEE